jgi:hypothetical protein
MLIDDPIRPTRDEDKMNILSTGFGIVYWNDYLYNSFLHRLFDQPFGEWNNIY